MVIGLKKLFADGGIKEINYRFSPDPERLEHCSEIAVSGRLFSKTSSISLELRADFALSLECDRCLRGFVKHFELPLCHSLVTSLNQEDNDEFILVKTNEIDLDELIVSDILLTLPMKHLCREDCKGLCAVCGKNLNESECGCEIKTADPRFEELLKLID